MYLCETYALKVSKPIGYTSTSAEIHVFMSRIEPPYPSTSKLIVSDDSL